MQNLHFHQLCRALVSSWIFPTKINFFLSRHEIYKTQKFLRSFFLFCFCFEFHFVHFANLKLFRSLTADECFFWWNFAIRHLTPSALAQNSLWVWENIEFSKNEIFFNEIFFIDWIFFSGATFHTTQLDCSWVIFGKQ